MIFINYKRLVEIQIFHEYYLFQADGTSFFELPNDTKKEQVLMDRVLGGLYNLSRDLEIVPTDETKQLMKSHKMKFVATSTGLLIGLEVEEVSKNGDTEYQPKIAPKENLVLSFQIKMVRSAFRNFTNMPFRPPLPAIYFFNNNPQDKQAPYLSLPISDIVASKKYRMGSLGLSEGTGELFEAPDHDTAGSDLSKWITIKKLQYANENDRKLLPHKFTYQFDLASKITEVTLTLRNEQDERVKKIQIKSDRPMRGAQADFSVLDGGTFDTPAPKIPPGRYQLVIKSKSETEVSEERYNIVLDSQRYDRQALGLIELVINKGNDDFELLKPNGNLKASPAKTHPIFQILFKSRRTYWRYISKKKKTLEAEPRADPFLEKEPTNAKNLISSNPRYLSVVPTLFQSDDPATSGIYETVFLPNPIPESLRLEKGRFYSDIHVGPLKDLIKDS